MDIRSSSSSVGIIERLKSSPTWCRPKLHGKGRSDVKIVMLYARQDNPFRELDGVARAVYFLNYLPVNFARVARCRSRVLPFDHQLHKLRRDRRRWRRLRTLSHEISGPSSGARPSTDVCTRRSAQ